MTVLVSDACLCRMVRTGNGLALATHLWLWWHHRHGTGPVKFRTGPGLWLVFYRCECGAERNP